MNKLAVIALSGLGVCAICIGVGSAVGGRIGFGIELDDGRPRCGSVTDAAATSRTLSWDGSDSVRLVVFSDARYAPSNDTMLHASGDPQVLAHLRVRNGTIELDCRGWRDRTKDLAITLPGREFQKFEVTGGRLTIARLEQRHVTIEIAGSGKVQASGKLEDDIKLGIAGSGQMDLGEITASRGKMEIAGSGTMKAQSVAINDLKLEIAGSGRAELAQLTAHTTRLDIAGSGTVIAKGAADDLSVEIGGSGRADFGNVASRTARVQIGGHGDVDIAPTEEAKIEIGGSGDVTLHSDPKKLDTEIGGSGRIHRLAGG